MNITRTNIFYEFKEKNIKKKEKINKFLCISDYYDSNMPIYGYFYKKHLYIILLLTPLAFLLLTHMFLLPSPFDTYARIVPSYRHILFKQQLFKQRLLSYNLVYNSPNSVCNYNKSSLNESQTDLFNKIPLLLQLYRRHIPRYPKDYFQSRGIVLTVGRQQIKYAKINLKLMELTGTKLPIEVLFLHFIYLLI